MTGSSNLYSLFDLGDMFKKDCKSRGLYLTLKEPIRLEIVKLKK